MDFKLFSDSLIEFLDNYRDATHTEPMYACYNHDKGMLACIIGILIFAKDHAPGCPGRFSFDEDGNDTVSVEEGNKLWKAELQELIDQFMIIYEKKHSPMLYDEAMEHLHDILFELWN